MVARLSSETSASKPKLLVYVLRSASDSGFYIGYSNNFYTHVLNKPGTD
jgi:predicted GIY-YIG superfamily endonuclease